MTKEPIIIDGCDVSGCEDYKYDGTCANSAYHLFNFETKYANCQNRNCYYKQLKRKEQECEEWKLKATSLDYADEICALEIDLKRKEQECEFWKKELDKTHLLMLKRQDELVKEILKNDQLKAENEILEKNRATVDAIIETLKAQFRQLKEENEKLKQTLTEIKEMCNSVENIENVKSLYDATISGMYLQARKILQKCEVLKNE